MPGEEDMYGGGGPSMAPEPAAEKQDRKEAAESGQTYLINRDVCPDMKVGDEMVVKIEAIHEKEYEVSYAPEKADDEGAPKEGMAPEAPEGAGGSGAPDSMYG
jgi:hypothetical protein